MQYRNPENEVGAGVGNLKVVTQTGKSSNLQLPSFPWKFESNDNLTLVETYQDLEGHKVAGGHFCCWQGLLFDAFSNKSLTMI